MNILIVMVWNRPMGGYHVVSEEDAAVRSHVFMTEGEEHVPTSEPVTHQVCPECGGIIGFGEEARHSCVDNDGRSCARARAKAHIEEISRLLHGC